jgi:hypothetical protein
MPREKLRTPPILGRLKVLHAARYELLATTLNTQGLAAIGPMDRVVGPAHAPTLALKFRIALSVGGTAAPALDFSF